MSLVKVHTSNFHILFVFFFLSKETIILYTMLACSLKIKISNFETKYFGRMGGKKLLSVGKLKLSKTVSDHMGTSKFLRGYKETLQ